MTRDTLVLGTAAGLLLEPDAVEDFDSAQSAEASVIFALRTKAYAPAGPAGEIVWRRIYATGWHRAEVAFHVTPIVDGRPLNELKTYVRKPAPERGREERFSFIVPLARFHPDYPGMTFGVIGSACEIYIEALDPPASWHIETATIYHEPIAQARNRTVDE